MKHYPARSVTRLKSSRMKDRLPLIVKRLPRVVSVLVVVLTPLHAFQNFDAEKLRIAAAQHEIIQILLKDKNFESVFGELDKILALRISAEYEDKVIREVRIISDAFLHNQRSDLAIRVLERGIQGVGQPKSKSALYQELGYVYRLQGNDLKAMECFRRAKQYAEKLTTRPF